MTSLPLGVRDMITVAVAFAAGVLSGAFSMGGQVVMKPAIRMLGASALEAVGTTVPMILPTVASATVGYARHGYIDWRAVAWSAPPGAVAAVAGALAAPVIPGRGHLLQIATALMLLFSAQRIARESRPTPVPPGSDLPPVDTPKDGPGVQAGRWTGMIDSEAHRGTGRLIAVGTLSGTLSGLLGVGGGILMVPGFNQLLRLPLRVAVATSLVCAGVFAIPATITHSMLGTIEWRLALLLTVGAVPGARVGAALMIRASDRRLRLAVASLISLVAVSYAIGELAAVLGSR